MLTYLYHYDNEDSEILLDDRRDALEDAEYCEGLWVSTTNTKYSWDTWRRMVDEQIDLAEDMKALYLIHLKDPDRLLNIDTLEKLKWLNEKYSNDTQYNDGIDWLSLSNEYDGIFIPAEISQSDENTNESLKLAWWLDMGCIWNTKGCVSHAERVPIVRPFSKEECSVSNNIELIGNGIERYNAIILEAPDIKESIGFKRSEGRKKAIYKYFEWLGNPEVNTIRLNQKNSLGIVITRELEAAPETANYKDDQCAYFYGPQDDLDKFIMSLLFDGHVSDIDKFIKDNVVNVDDGKVAFFVELSENGEN